MASLPSTRGRRNRTAGTSRTFHEYGEAVANEALRHAMDAVRFTDYKLAAKVGVDVKTISRWKADPGRVPHARHRWATADALGVDESVLWPDALQQTIKTGVDREVVAVYSRRADCPTAVWRRLLTNATDTITFAGYTNYFLWLQHPTLTSVLRRKAECGTAVRFLLGNPDSDVTHRREQIEDVPLSVGVRIRSTLAELDALRDQRGVDARFSDAHIAMSVFLFDRDAMVTPHLSAQIGHDSPLLHLRRRQDDGLYDRFASHIDDLWSEARPVWRGT